MKNFYIITNMLKDPGFKISTRIADYIEKNGRRCSIAKLDSEGFVLPETIPEDIDCGIVLGGDGTLIRAAREMKGRGIPFLGINLGALGYLQEVELKNYETALDRLFCGDYYIEERMMIEGVIEGRMKDTALNDIVLTRLNSLHILKFDVYVNGEHLNTYKADGIIVCAPTGITGYNLSAGGPIVDPTSRMIVMTPICPHSFNKSSVVLSEHEEIDIIIREGVHGEKEGAALTLDGARALPLHEGERIHIRSAEETFRLVRLSRQSFLKTMRDKMKES